MKLAGKTIAVLVEADYQDLEVWYPVLRLREEGARVLVVGTGSATTYRGKNGYPIDAGITAAEVKASDLHGIVIPGGWAPDRLRQYDAVLRLVKAVSDAGGVVSCICHGGWVLASADVVRGKRLTCFKAIRDDMANAGATVVDEECVRDGNLVTSRKPDDLPAFMRVTIQALSGG